MPKHINIDARRWFQKRWGNTYHSVSVWVDGECVGIVTGQYGYGDHFLDTAYKVLNKSNTLRKKFTYDTFIAYLKDNPKTTHVCVCDVEYKRDLWQGKDF